MAPVDRLHIAVSVNGEGSGHAMRMSALCGALSREHQLSVWCPKHTIESMRPNLPEATFYRLPPVPTIYKGNAVDYVATIRANFGVLFLRSKKLYGMLSRKLTRLGIDMVLSDYEPALPFAARRAGIPVALFNHQGVVNRHKAFKLSWFVARIVNQVMMPYGTYRYVSSFYNGDVGALLRREIRHARPTRGDYVLVYARRAFEEHIVPALDSFPDTPFRVFPGYPGDFVESLIGCRGVVAPAGHQLISEALHLGKPMLVFPQRGQYEQELNGCMLVRSGRGMVGNIKDVRGSLANFLDGLDSYPFHAPAPEVEFCMQDDTPKAVDLVLERARKVAKERAARRARVHGAAPSPA
jgi:UDP:flavonoid glycosyltransferase YjiC (YdhE family)